MEIGSREKVKRRSLLIDPINILRKKVHFTLRDFYEISRKTINCCQQSFSCKGSYINDVMQFWTIFDPPYCVMLVSFKVLNPKSVTSFIDDQLKTYK